MRLWPDGSRFLVNAAAQPGAPYWLAGSALAVLGVGMGLAVPACSTLVMNLVPPERSGMASATTNAIRQTGMTLGVALLASLMSQGAVTSLSSRLDPAHPNVEQRIKSLPPAR